MSVSSCVAVVRRSGNYKPTIWDYEFIQSLKTGYSQSQHKHQLELIEQLKEEVKKALDECNTHPLRQLELISDLERLGLRYHFEHDIESILRSIHSEFDHRTYWAEKGLQASALAFRILRQQGHDIPEAIFAAFIDESSEEFKECLSEDTQGLLSLYEASFFSVEGETILRRAREFATKHLREHLKRGNQETIRHALELPLHWRPHRLDSRWFIDIYEIRPDKNHTLLKLSKLDFNVMQARHQEELKKASRWWHNTNLMAKITFSRDRLMEVFLWTVGIAYEPQFEYMRKILTQVISIISTIDDIYDVYGTLDELKRFTDAVERWDLKTMEELPDYMKICYFLLFNSTNEVGFDTMKNRGINIVPHLVSAWTHLCKTYLGEAEWYYTGYTPTLQEYLDNAWISTSIPLVLVYVYHIVTSKVTDEAMECLQPGVYCDMIRWSSIIGRLTDDLGTSSDELQRGDVPKAIQCYMHESGASEKDAREHIRQMIGEIWDKMNKEVASNSLFCRDFMRIAMNIARMSQCVYQYGDGHAGQGKLTKDRVSSVLLQSITP